VLRALLEFDALYLPKPVFAQELALKPLTPREALELSLLWQNCIRNAWIDKMLTGDLAFVLSEPLQLLAMLQRLTGEACGEIWLLREIAAPHNGEKDPGKVATFTEQLLKGNVVVWPGQDEENPFLPSVIAFHMWA